MVDLETNEIANAAIGAIDAAWPLHKAALIVFHPADAPEAHALYSNAAAAQLIPVLRAALARLEAGDLRMPVGGGGFQWVETATEG